MKRIIATVAAVVLLMSSSAAYAEEHSIDTGPPKGVAGADGVACTGTATHGDYTLKVTHYEGVDPDHPLADITGDDGKVKRGEKAQAQMRCERGLHQDMTYFMRNAYDGRYCDGAGGRTKGVGDGPEFSSGGFYCHTKPAMPDFDPGSIRVTFRDV